MEGKERDRRKGEGMQRKVDESKQAIKRDCMIWGYLRWNETMSNFIGPGR